MDVSLPIAEDASNSASSSSNPPMPSASMAPASSEGFTAESSPPIAVPGPTAEDAADAASSSSNPPMPSASMAPASSEGFTAERRFDCGQGPFSLEQFLECYDDANCEVALRRWSSAAPVSADPPCAAPDTGMPEQSTEVTKPITSSSKEARVRVSGGLDEEASSMNSGLYVLSGSHMKRDVYHKIRSGPDNGEVSNIYFWEEPGDADSTGWWMGPEVGGDQATAYNASTSLACPTTGWRAPFDGPVDPSIKVEMLAVQHANGTYRGAEGLVSLARPRHVDEEMSGNAGSAGKGDKPCVDF